MHKELPLMIALFSLAAMSAAAEDFNGDLRDASRLVELASKSAEQGHAEGQYLLGTLYMQGKGVPKNEAMAAEWFQKGALQGHAESQWLLGLLYDQGRGVPEDDAIASEWYGKAAEQGDPLAQRNLGLQYFQGHGVPENYVKAYAWVSIAAAQGDAAAKDAKNLVRKSMTRPQIAEAQKLSGEYWQRYVVPFQE